MLPDEWTACTLNDCVERIIDYRGKSVPKSESGVPLITARNVRAGCLDFSEAEYISHTDYEAWTSRGNPNPNDVIFTTEAPLGNVALFPVGQYVVGQRVVVLQPRSLTVNATFLMYYLLSPAGQLQIALRSSGTTATGIKQTELRKVEVLLPSIKEQQKIAAILSTWDRAIELIEKLIAAKQQRKLALMQQLLTGKTRLRGHETNVWKKYDLGEVASNSTLRNDSTEKVRTVYSVTNSVGMIPMAEDVIGESIERYKAVAPRDFAYNPMRINVGSIAMWQGAEEVLVSPDYVVFRCGPDLDADFLNHFRTTDYWRQFVNRAGGGSVRVRIYFDDLAEMPLKLPPINEQKAIAAVLNTQDREIELHRQKLDALRRQKKGLMQQLLTGKVRVKVPAEAPGV